MSLAYILILTQLEHFLLLNFVLSRCLAFIYSTICNPFLNKFKWNICGVSAIREELMHSVRQEKPLFMSLL